MIEPTASDIGRKVIYTGNTHPGGKPEYGVVTAYNEICAFVRYGAELRAKATNFDDLEWDSQAEPPAAEKPEPDLSGLQELYDALRGVQAALATYRAIQSQHTAQALFRAAEHCYELELLGSAAFDVITHLTEQFNVEGQNA